MDSESPGRARSGHDAPTTYIQDSWRFLELTNPGSAALHACVAHRIDPAVDATVLRAAWLVVLARHEVLRARFPTDGSPELVNAVDAVPVSFVEVPLPPSELAEHAIATIGAAWAREPFDLAAGPAIRLVLMRSRADAAAALLLVAHHA